MRSYLTRLGQALSEGSITAVRWLTAPILAFVILAVLAYGAYDYYVTRTANREIVAAINSGKLAQIIASQVQQAAQKSPQPKPQGAP